MVLIKRILILGLIVSSLVLLEANADETLLINLPSDEDVINSLREKQKQEDLLAELLTKEVERDQVQDYETLFDMSVRHEFVIEFSQEEWDGLNNDMYEYFLDYGNYKSNNYRNVTITYTAGEETFVIEDVGIRSKGNDFSRNTTPEDSEGNVNEIHYMLKFNETFDHLEETDEYTELKKREVFNVEQLLLKRNNQEDPAHLNEVFSYHLFREAGVVVPDASMAVVKLVVDGEVKNTHLYNVFEQMDDEFVRQNMQEEPKKEIGDLYKVKWGGSMEPIYTNPNSYHNPVIGVREWESNYRPIYSLKTNKDDPNYDTLIDFTRNLDEEDLDIRYEFINNNFDVDSFIRAMAVNVLTGNPDDYRGHANNYYLYFDETGYLTYIPFDYDNSFMAGWNGADQNGEGHCNWTLCNDIYYWGELPWAQWSWESLPLWDNIIVYEEYQILYEDYMMEYIESGLFSEATYLEMFHQVNELYGNEFLLSYDKSYFINEKIRVVTEQVTYYRNER